MANGYKCGKCGSGPLCNDDDRLMGIKYIACLNCGNRYPPGPAPVKNKGSETNSKDDSMENAQKTSIEIEDKSVCKECGKKPTISPGSPYCPSCMAKLSHKNKRSSQSVSKAVEKKKAYTTSKPDSATRSQVLNDTITIEFKRHISVLKAVEKLADREMRPLDCQILYILKKYIEAEDR